jgi:transposase-like protein
MWWAARVAELEGGASAASIGRRYQVQPRTLLWWQAEFRRRSRRTPKEQRLVAVEITQSSQQFDGGRKAPEVEAAFETKRGRLTVRGALSAEHLSALAEVLRA